MKCPVCGETDPGSRWYCLPRLAGLAKEGQPCAYSLEGDARFKKKMELKIAAAGAPRR